MLLVHPPPPLLPPRALLHTPLMASRVPSVHPPPPLPPPHTPLMASRVPLVHPPPPLPPPRTQLMASRRVPSVHPPPALLRTLPPPRTQLMAPRVLLVHPSRTLVLPRTQLLASQVPSSPPQLLLRLLQLHHAHCCEVCLPPALLPSLSLTPDATTTSTNHICSLIWPSATKQANSTVPVWPASPSLL